MLQAVTGTAPAAAPSQAMREIGVRQIHGPADYGIQLPEWLCRCIDHVPPGAGDSCPTDAEGLLAAAFHFAFQLHRLGSTVKPITQKLSGSFFNTSGIS